MVNKNTFKENFKNDSFLPSPSLFPENVEYATAYVPFQNTSKMFNLEESLHKGTVFCDLYQPYVKGGI